MVTLTRPTLPTPSSPGADPGASVRIGPAPADGAGATVRLRVDLGYDGSDFHGWAVQPGMRTVQGEFSHALRLALRLAETPLITVAGRTDAGVHARGQVAHLDLAEQLWSAAAPTALRHVNRVLPGDIRVAALRAAPAGFDARFSALSRRYSYRVCDSPPAADPLRRRDTLWHRWPLDPGRMNEAAAACLGEHDFAAFCRPREGASTVRELLRLEWQRTGPGIVTGTVVADAFCHNMVRALAGALLAVGDGRRPVSWMADVLAARVRDPAVTVAPPHPLCLEEVRYPPDEELAKRAVLTRRVREQPPAEGG
jgi:tRNA pseudouridine38-40 synthase